MFDQTLMALAQKIKTASENSDTIAGIKENYAPNAKSIEAADFGGGNVVTEGTDALIAKHEAWYEMTEMHSSSIEGPFFHGDNKFSFIFEMDCTNKHMGERMQMREVGIYTAENGKIVCEEFFAPIM